MKALFGADVFFPKPISRCGDLETHGNDHYLCTILVEKTRIARLHRQGIASKYDETDRDFVSRSSKRMPHNCGRKRWEHHQGGMMKWRSRLT